MEEIGLDWSGAEVKEGKLRVPLTGKPPSEWKQHFETTEKLIGQDEWGEIKLRKGGVSVAGISEGVEEKLRFHLEALVEQANASLRAAEEAQAAEEADEDDDDEDDSGPDAEMTKRFREFAEEREQAPGEAR